MHSDTDIARELRERRLTTSIAIVTNGKATHWDISKQGKPTGATTSAELFAFYKAVLKFSDIRNFSSSLGYPNGKPSLAYEDNA
eukprot:4912847-Ditylum_brightwellii.AAC.1